MSSAGLMRATCYSESWKISLCKNFSLLGGRSRVWKEGSGPRRGWRDAPETCQLVSISRAFKSFSFLPQLELLQGFVLHFLELFLLFCRPSAAHVSSFQESMSDGVKFQDLAGVWETPTRQVRFHVPPYFPVCIIAETQRLHIKSEAASKTNVQPPLPKVSLGDMRAALVSSPAWGCRRSSRISSAICWLPSSNYANYIL